MLGALVNYWENKSSLTVARPNARVWQSCVTENLSTTTGIAINDSVSQLQSSVGQPEGHVLNTKPGNSG